MSPSSFSRVSRGAFALCAGVAALRLFPASSLATSRGTTTRPIARSLLRGFAAEPLATDSLRPVERSFLEKAVEQSRQHQQIARLAASQASNADVRSLAQQIATDHREIGDRVETLRRRKGVVEDSPTGDIITEPQQKLAQKAGAEFDREYLRVLAEQHGETMALFEQAVTNAKDNDVRELAGGFLPTLREHYNRIVELRKAIE